MKFITTFNEDIYQICGRELIESFISTGNCDKHELIIFFEDTKNPHTEYYPNWLTEWADKEYLSFVNLMTCKYKGTNIVDCIDIFLRPRIQFTDEYASPRSVKWFRPVASIYFASTYFENKTFCSIDADCKFIDLVDDEYIHSMVTDHHIAFLGRENFKTMRHGGYDSAGNYVQTNQVSATDKDTHTETGFIVFNLQKDGTQTFIERNLEYWTKHIILELKYQTDCHTFDAVRNEMQLRYNNLCDPIGEVSPIGSRVIEASVAGKFLTHNKGTIGPILYNKQLLK